MKIKFAVIVMTLLSFSCKSSKENSTQKPLHSGTYHILSVNGDTVTSYNITLKIDTEKKRVSGNAGCNGYSAFYTLEKDTIEMGLARVTTQYCKGKMAVERSYLKSLKHITRYQYKTSKLLLRSADGKYTITATQETTPKKQ